MGSFSLEADFARVETQFTQHIRDPERHRAPSGVDGERLGVYREMVYNTVEGLIASNFPVLRRILGKSHWHALVRDYFAHHKAHTPLFPKIAQEFLAFLEKERDQADDPPFILELAHYEWVEAALMTDPREISWQGIDPNGDLLARVPVLSPLAWPLSYRYPVHRLGPDHPLPQEEQTYLVVFRDRNDEVGFMELNPVSALLLERIQQNENKGGRELLHGIASTLRHPDTEVVINGGLEVMQRLLRRDVLLGVKVASP
ncbi:MAG: HvfC family RiPP maturation protein [Gammaproteobacteria bacterium]